MTAATAAPGPIARLREPNPVLVKEMRARFRGARAFAVLTLFLLLLLAAVGLFTGLQWILFRMASGPHGAYSIGSSPAVTGQALFALLTTCQLVVVALIGPALTMNTISGEVERQTYELLLATPLSGGAILRGKVGAAMGYILLLVLSALPLTSTISLLGGVSAGDMLLAQAQILSAGLFFVMLGAFFSAVTRSTARAAILSYLFIGLILFTVFFSTWFLGILGFLDPSASLGQVCMGGFGLGTYLGHLPGLGSVIMLIWGQYLSMDRIVIALSAVNAIALQLMLVAVLYLVASARIRGADQRTVRRLTLLWLAIWVWSIWATLSEGIAANTSVSMMRFPAVGSGTFGIDSTWTAAAGAALPAIPGLLWLASLALVRRRSVE